MNSPAVELSERVRQGLPHAEANQFPRIHLVPEGLSNWDDADDACFLSQSYGLALDPWQQLVVRSWLGHDDRGKWAASVCGVAVPRQNGKNAIIEAVELYMMVVLGYKILHTAHEGKTAHKAFERVKEFFENDNYPELKGLVKSIFLSRGQEKIELTNGGSVEFIARTRSSGRGFTADVLIFDEAQELTDEQLGALLPTISAAPAGNPLQIYLGTPPTSPETGLVWARTQKQAADTLDPESSTFEKRLAWCEWSIEARTDPETGDLDTPDLDDTELWWQTNPAYGVRIDSSVITGERSVMEDATFARERLGMWSPEGQLRVIPVALWEAAASPDDYPQAGQVVYAVDMNPERTWASIVACRRQRGQLHVVLMEAKSCEDGTEWITNWLCTPKRKPNLVVIDSRSPAAAIIPNLLQKRQKKTILETTTGDYLRACSGFMDLLVANRNLEDVNTPHLTHHDQEPMNNAINAGTKRKIGSEGGWGWNRVDRSSDITPLVAATLATYAMVKERRVVTARPIQLR